MPTILLPPLDEQNHHANKRSYDEPSNLRIQIRGQLLRLTGVALHRPDGGLTGYINSHGQTVRSALQGYGLLVVSQLLCIIFDRLLSQCWMAQ